MICVVQPTIGQDDIKECCIGCANWLQIPIVCYYILATVYGEFIKVNVLWLKLESLC